MRETSSDREQILPTDVGQFSVLAVRLRFNPREETTWHSYFSTSLPFRSSGVTIISKSSVPCVNSPPGVAPSSSTIARPADSTVQVVATHPARHSSRSFRLEAVRWPYSRAPRTTQRYSTDFVRASRYDTISTPRSTDPLLTRDRSLSRVSVTSRTSLPVERLRARKRHDAGSVVPTEPSSRGDRLNGILSL
ncbi:MAG: hypothetical protein A07HR67_00175 [uncultured archaeon A07HR67]|nr:MAG: hypothetical protein A07HR67_00175 [uncultured archaeon A07HR67]